MRIVFILTFAANIVLGVVSLYVLPDRVGTNFGTGGEVNSYAGRETQAIIMLVADVVAFLLLYCATNLTFAAPPWLVNLPNKHYWLRPENAEKGKAILRRRMDEMGVLVFGWLLCIGVLVIRANLREPPRLDTAPFVALMVVFLASVVWWTVRVYRAFRVPGK